MTRRPHILIVAERHAPPLKLNQILLYNADSLVRTSCIQKGTENGTKGINKMEQLAPDPNYCKLPLVFSLHPYLSRH